MTNKITLDRELAESALNAVEYLALRGDEIGTSNAPVAEAMRAALAEQPQADAKPIGYMNQASIDAVQSHGYASIEVGVNGFPPGDKAIPVYTHPAPAKVEPVPPAGEEVEVLATVDTHGTLLRGSKPLRSVELVDRAHVTRLQAEVERLRQAWFGMKTERDTLRAQFATETARADAAVGDANEADRKLTELKDEIIDHRNYTKACREEREARQSELTQARESLAERDALLGAIAGWTIETRTAVLEAFQDELNESASYPWYDAAIADLMRLVEALSASAEPSAPPCPDSSDCCIDGHSYWCPNHPRSATVERDERADFESWYIRDVGIGLANLSRVNSGGRPYEDEDAMSAWEGWLARAALERKA